MKCKCKHIFHVLTMKWAMQKAGRKLPYIHSLSYSSPEDDLKKWISGERDRDLILSWDLIKGFEHSVIIDTLATHNVSSRCSSKLIKLSPNIFLDLLLVCEKVLRKNYHKCNEAIHLSKDQLNKINFSLQDLLGE